MCFSGLLRGCGEWPGRHTRLRGFGAGITGFPPKPCHLPAGWPWVSRLTSLCLLSQRQDGIKDSPASWVAVQIEGVLRRKHLGFGLLRVLHHPAPPGLPGALHPWPAPTPHPPHPGCLAPLAALPTARHPSGPGPQGDLAAPVPGLKLAQQPSIAERGAVNQMALLTAS